MSRPRWLVVLTALAAIALPVSANEPPSFGACDQRVRDAPLQLESYRCYLRASIVPGGAPRAVRRLQAILTIDPDNPYAEMMLAALHARAGAGDPDARYRAAIRELQSRGDVATEILAWSLLIDHRIGHGEFDAARDAIATIHERADAFNAAPARHVADLAEAQLASREGHYDQAHAMLESLEADIVENGESRGLSRWLSQMGFMYWATGRPADAARCYERRLALIEDTAEEYEEPSIRYNLALMTSMAMTKPASPDDWDALRDRFTDALRIARAQGNRPIELKSRIALADIDAANAAISRSHLRHALELATELGYVEDYLLALRAIGWSLVLHEPRDIQQAFEIAEEAIARAQAVGDPIQEARGRFCLAVWRSESALESGWSGSDREDAVAAFESALGSIETMRRMQTDDEIRARTFGVWTFVYRRFVEIALRGHARTGSKDDLDIAFRTVERMHARDLLDELDAAGATLPVSPSIPALEDLRAALAPGEVLLGFQLGADQLVSRPSWLLAHTRDGTRVYELPPWPEIQARVDVFGGLVHGDDGPEDAAVTLYRMLVEPALRDLDTEATHLVVLADGPLHRLPFAALRPERDAEPIGATYLISVVPSGTAWLRMRSQTNRTDRVVVFADPATGRSAIADVRDHEPGWGSLPWARQEARSIARTLDHVVVRNGRAATPTAVRDESEARAAIVHFATHAYTDWDHPDRSAVVLAPGAGDDGRLRVRDIVDLDLDGAVVVLSACGSASGTPLDGEGPMSLARAFFVAGARTVVATLWPLRDRDARAFFDPFYEALARGESVSGAATAARAVAIEAGVPPSAWAGIVVAGDGNAVPVPGGVQPSRVPHTGWWFALLAIAGAVMFATRRLALS